MFQNQHAGQNHNIKVGNITIERVEQFTHLGTALINKNSIHKKMITIWHTLFTQSYCVKPNLQGLTWFECREDTNGAL
jgi:hypothetical protein